MNRRNFLRQISALSTVAVAGQFWRPAAAQAAVIINNRIVFDAGATSESINTNIGAGEVRDYSVRAGKGQILVVVNSSPRNDLRIDILGANGINPRIIRGSAGQYTQVGLLPSSQDYIIRVQGGAAATTTSFNVVIPSRIAFKRNAFSATVNGTVTRNRTVTYFLRAGKGQSLNVNLTSPLSKVRLTIYGFDDGIPLVRASSGATNWVGTLPLTQDYVIEAVPAIETSTYSLYTYVY